MTKSKTTLWIGFMLLTQACSPPAEQHDQASSLPAEPPVQAADSTPQQAETHQPPETPDPTVTHKPPVMRGYEIVHTYPHDTNSYTQGLLFHAGALYEGTGRPKKSCVRVLEVETGQVLKQHNLESHLFGEGLALANGRLYQLTWHLGAAFIYDAATLEPLGQHEYRGEGWGLTFDGTHLVMSDGSPTLQFRDPETFEVERTLDVWYASARGQQIPLQDVNELEIVEGELWANVYQQEVIARIDLETGRVRSWIDLSGLQAMQGVEDLAQDVLNGIAYDSEGKRIFVAGKHWPNLYEIRVTGED